MRYMAKRFIFLLILVIFFTCFFVPAADAYVSEQTDWTEWETLEVSDATKEKIWEYLQLQEIHATKKFTSPIVSFDVRNDGKVVLATRNNKIMLFDANFELVKVFQFKTDGSYLVFWHHDNIVLFTWRGEDVILFDENGNYVDILKLDSNGSTYKEISKASRLKTDLEIGDRHYFVEKADGIAGFFAGYEYRRLVCKEASGNECTIYDIGKTCANVSAVITMLCLLVPFVIGFIILLLGVIIPKAKKRYNVQGRA